jgi:Mg-chelatase subunit ChlD
MLNKKHAWGWLILGVALIAQSAVAYAANDKPVAEKDLVSLIELEIGDEAIVAKIQKGGLSFKVDDEILERLKEAGASEAVLNAVKEAKPAKPAKAPKAAITYEQVLQLLMLGVDEDAILARLQKSPTVFTLDASQTEELTKAGASEKLLAAMQGQRKISAEASEMISDLAIVLDCSGSMREKTKEGDTKMDVAKRVVTELIEKIPDGLNVTFVVYGHEAFGSADDPRNCKAVKIARPLSVLDAAGKAELGRMISEIKPTGATPIALSLKTAGEELAKNKAFCGLVLITDGLETCKGDPEAEAATLAKNLKLSYGVNVVGFDVKESESESLKEIATAGNGKYYNANSTEELQESIGTISKELDKAAKPAPKQVFDRRAVKFLKPDIDMPQMEEIVLIEAGNPIKAAKLYRKASIKKYGDEIRIPSGTAKYDIVWFPKDGEGIRIVKDLTLPERKLVEVKLEDLVGLIKVNGTGKPTVIFANAAGQPAVNSYSTQRAKKFGDVMVVPVGSYDVYVDDSVLEEGLNVEAGKSYELQ